MLMRIPDKILHFNIVEQIIPGHSRSKNFTVLHFENFDDVILNFFRGRGGTRDKSSVRNQLPHKRQF